MFPDSPSYELSARLENPGPRPWAGGPLDTGDPTPYPSFPRHEPVRGALYLLLLVLDLHKGPRPGGVLLI